MENTTTDMSDTSDEKMRDSSSGELNPGINPAAASGLDTDMARGRGIKVGSFRLPPWRSPLAQVILVGFVCFLCPGMFNALGGLGGGGQVDATVADNAMVALYSTFASVSFFAGTVNNYLGTPRTLSLGGIGYALYTASFLSYNHNQNHGFVIASGAILGICASLLWTAQGTVMMSYPTESEKGRYIGYFWAIFNLGAVIGSAIPIGQNWNSTEGSVNDGTYIAFFVLMVCGFILAFFLAPPHKIIRNDLTRVEQIRHPSAWSEFKGLFQTLKTDYYIVMLFPMFWASNWFYTYQFNDMNAYYFNIRTRAFNSLFYWLAQIFGALLFGRFLDWKRFSRRTRAISGWCILFILVNVIWGGGLAFERKTNRDWPSPRQDIFDPGYVGNLFLYMFYGLLDATWQTYSYWLMGALSNEPRKLAYFAGFYKSIQSAGAAVIWRVDALKAPFQAIFASSWGLCGAGLLFALPVVWMRITQTNIHKEDYVTAREVGIGTDEKEQRADNEA